MKVTFEFDGLDDKGELKMHEICSDMFLALCDLKDYARSIGKGYETLSDPEKVLDKLNEIVSDSKIYEVD